MVWDTRRICLPSTILSTHDRGAFALIPQSVLTAASYHLTQVSTRVKVQINKKNFQSIHLFSKEKKRQANQHVIAIVTLSIWGSQRKQTGPQFMSSIINQYSPILGSTGWNSQTTDTGQAGSARRTSVMLWTLRPHSRNIKLGSIPKSIQATAHLIILLLPVYTNIKPSVGRNKQ
jgi:hypothetical protein